MRIAIGIREQWVNNRKQSEIAKINTAENVEGEGEHRGTSIQGATDRRKRGRPIGEKSEGTT